MLNPKRRSFYSNSIRIQIGGERWVNLDFLLFTIAYMSQRFLTSITNDWIRVAFVFCLCCIYKLWSVMMLRVGFPCFLCYNPFSSLYCALGICCISIIVLVLALVLNPPTISEFLCARFTKCSNDVAYTQKNITRVRLALQWSNITVSIQQVTHSTKLALH
jgi:hypothetical protein